MLETLASVFVHDAFLVYERFDRTKSAACAVAKMLANERLDDGD